MEPDELGLPGLSFTAALSKDRAEEAASPPPLPASRRASKNPFSRRTSHLQASPSGCDAVCVGMLLWLYCSVLTCSFVRRRPALSPVDMDAVERIVTQRRLQVCPSGVAHEYLEEPGLTRVCVQVNTDALSALPFAGAAADIVLESASSHVPPCWLRCVCAASTQDA